MNTKRILLQLLIVLIAVANSFSSFGQTKTEEPWTNEQLIEPAELAGIINDSKTPKPVIFSIGPNATIKGSIDIGFVTQNGNLKKLETELLKLLKDTSIVIYCGCCPFQHCPNIRPAFSLLNKMKFTNHKLLDLPKNIKVDWIDKGYPKRN